MIHAVKNSIPTKTHPVELNRILMFANNKTLIVTGGGSGIGRELVKQLLEKGARVAAIDINNSALVETKKLCGEWSKNLSLHTLNIADRVHVEQLPDAILKIHGSIDGLINNAGIIQPFIKVNELSYEAIDRVLNVNLLGVIYMTKTFLPYLLKQQEAHIVNISSMGGFLPVPGQTVYGASKAAVKLFTEGLHSELRGTSVAVTVIFPGAIATNITENSGIRMDTSKIDSSKTQYKMLTAEHAARQIISAMEQNAFRACIGSDSKFMDFIYRLHPKFAASFIAKKMGDLLN